MSGWDSPPSVHVAQLITPRYFNNLMTLLIICEAYLTISVALKVG